MLLLPSPWRRLRLIPSNKSTGVLICVVYNKCLIGVVHLCSLVQYFWFSAMLNCKATSTISKHNPQKMDNYKYDVSF